MIRDFCLTVDKIGDEENKNFCMNIPFSVSSMFNVLHMWDYLRSCLVTISPRQSLVEGNNSLITTYMNLVPVKIVLFSVEMTVQESSYQRSLAHP